MLYSWRSGQGCHFSHQQENKCSWGKRLTPMSDPNSGLKAGLDLPDNLARPNFMVCVGGMEGTASPADAKQGASLCFAAGEVRWAPAVPSSPRMGIYPSCTAALSHILCSCMGWWPRVDLVLAQMLWNDRAWDPGLDKSTLDIDGLCDSSNLLNKLHPVP